MTMPSTPENQAAYPADCHDTVDADKANAVEQYTAAIHFEFMNLFTVFAKVHIDASFRSHRQNPYNVPPCNKHWVSAMASVDRNDN